jgi:hypothetical protein
LAFLGTPQINEFIKLKLFILHFVIDEPTDRRSDRSRKPKIHFSGPSKPSNAPKKPSAAPKASTKPPPTTKSSKKPSETPLDPPGLPILDLIKELCSQTAELDIKAEKKAEKKAKSDEISRLVKLGFQGVLKEIKPLKEIEYEPLILRDH